MELEEALTTGPQGSPLAGDSLVCGLFLFFPLPS